MNDADCTTSPEMQDIGQYLFRYVHCTCYIHVLAEHCSFLLQVSEWYHSLALNVSLLPPRYTRASDLIPPGFFVLRTYALWNSNRIVLVAILSTLFASPMPSIHLIP